MLDIPTLRKHHGMSQADLARRMHISIPTLISIEKGRRALTVAERLEIERIFSLVEETTSSQNLDMRIDIPQKKLEKFRQVFLYILEKVGSRPNIGMTALYKILYFIDFDYYEKFEEQLMGLTYIKNHHGPTPKEFMKVVEEMKAEAQVEEVQSKYFKYDQKKFLPLVSANLSLLSANELKLIDTVLERFADKSAKELSEYSHGDVPWMSHEVGEPIAYESVFYRNDPYSVKQYADDL